MNELSLQDFAGYGRPKFFGRIVLLCTRNYSVRVFLMVSQKSTRRNEIVLSTGETKENLEHCEGLQIDMNARR